MTVTVGDPDGEDGFSVEDEDPRISPDESARVFAVGYTTASDGTGLGLAIVHEITMAHGWFIQVTEGTASGARFEVRTTTKNVGHVG